MSGEDVAASGSESRSEGESGVGALSSQLSALCSQDEARVLLGARSQEQGARSQALSTKHQAQNSKCRLAILVSGGGTTLQAIIDAIEAGNLAAQIVSVVSSRRDVKAPERARKHGVPVSILRPRDFQDIKAYDEALCDALTAVSPDLIVLAGYMSILGERVMSAFAGRIMNIHPSLLPSFGGKGFYGDHVHAKVLEYGCKVSGATVMFVDYNVDTGPIILQEAVDVEQSDTVASLAAKVQGVERSIYIKAISLFAAGRLKVRGRLVEVIDGGAKE